MDLLRIAAGVGGIQRLRCLQYQAVKLAQSMGGFFTLDGFALEGIVNRFSKRIPEFLLQSSLNRHALRLVLPVLLQAFDCINAQLRFGTQRFCFFNHRVASGGAARAGRCQGGIGFGHGCCPERLDFSKGFLTQRAGFAPLGHKAIECADVELPVAVAGGLHAFMPGSHGIDQHLAFCFDGFALGLDCLQPGFNGFVGFVAGIVKTLPQRMVRNAALVGGFPLLAQVAQGVLLFAPAQGFGLQGFGFGEQFFTNLVGTPALPAFELTSGGQCGMGSGFESAVNVAHMLLEGLAQFSGNAGGRFAMAFSDFMLQF